MPRPFTAADVLQGKQAAVGTAGSPVVDAGHGLDNPTAGGTCGIIFQIVGNILDPPEQWDDVIGAGTADVAQLVGMFLRADLPAGETQWEVRAGSSTATAWCWRAEEWTNVSRAPILATARTNSVALAATSIDIGPTSPTLDTAEYAALLVVVGIQGGTAGGSVFPATATYTNGFTETQVLQNGDGTATLEYQLRIARKLLTSPETGPWSTTVDFGAQPMTNKTTWGAMVALRPERFVGEA